MNRKWERVVLGAVLGLAAVGAYAALQTEDLGTYARHAGTVAAVLTKQVGPAVQVVTAAAHGDFEPATAIATALISPAAQSQDIVEPTNDCVRERALARIQTLTRNHRLMVIRVRALRACKRS